MWEKKNFYCKFCFHMWMWTEYVANESFERAWAACICQAYEIAEIRPSEIREKRHTGTRRTEFSTLYCDVPESFVSTFSCGSGCITKIRPFPFYDDGFMGERYVRGSTYFLFFFVVRARSLFTLLYSLSVLNAYTFIYIISFWLYYIF